MRRTILWLALALTLAACGGGEEAMPTQVPLAQDGGSAGVVSPRDAIAPAAGLPPTWTPAPPATVVTPSAAEALPANDRTIYRVLSGDTLGEIAERFGVSLALLAEVNRIDDIDIIEVDQELIIPAP